MQTFKITFELNTPISFIDIPTFDGLLSYAFAREKLKGQGFAQKLNIAKEEMIDFSEMPIAMHKNGYFMASRMLWNENKAIEHIQRWRKRWANKYDKIADFGKNKRKIQISKGSFKSYDIPLSCVTVNEVWFYFQSNNPKEIERLLTKWVYFIGKKRSQGYGEISSFMIEPSDFDFSGIFRPIPTSFMSNYSGEIRYCSWKPPYWLPENFKKCFIR